MEDLNKSFCLDDSEIIKPTTEQNLFDENESMSEIAVSGLVPNASCNNNILMCSPEQKASNPSSELNEFNLVDRSLHKETKEKKYFFRQVTKTQCQVNADEERLFVEKILNYYKQNNIKDNNVEIGKCQPNKPSLDLEEDKDEERYEMDSLKKLLTSQNEKGLELRILETNNEKFNKNNQFNFNIIVIGARNSGKSTFIKSFIKRLIQMKRDSMLYSNVYNSITIESKKKSSSNESSSNSVICSGTKRTKDFNCYRFPILVLNRYCEFNLIDTPGYDSETSTKVWVKDIKRYIKNKVISSFNLI